MIPQLSTTYLCFWQFTLVTVGPLLPFLNIQHLIVQEIPKTDSHFAFFVWHYQCNKVLTEKIHQWNEGRCLFLCVWSFKCLSVIFGFWGRVFVPTQSLLPFFCCWVSSKDRSAKHGGSMCPSKSGWYEAWGLRPAREMEWWDWLIQRLRNQHVTLSTAHCHSASTHTESTEKLLDHIQIQYAKVPSDEQEEYWLTVNNNM